MSNIKLVGPTRKLEPNPMHVNPPCRKLDEDTYVYGPYAAEGGELARRLDKIETRLTTIESRLGIFNIEIVEVVRPQEEKGCWLHYCTKQADWLYTKDSLLCCIHCRVKRDPPSPPADKVISEGGKMTESLSW